MGSCKGGNSITVNCKNCKIGGYHDSSFMTSGTRPAQVSMDNYGHVPKKQYLCSVIQVVSHAHDSARTQRRVSPK